jgi:putative FmdB family regulatory protein
MKPRRLQSATILSMVTTSSGTAADLSERLVDRGDRDTHGVPIYEYRCSKGHTFEVMQKMTDDPVTKCEVCGAKVERVFHPVAVHFKGKGFYNTDYGTKKRARELKDSAESGAAKTEAKAAEKKSESKKADSAKPAKKSD